MSTPPSVTHYTNRKTAEEPEARRIEEEKPETKRKRLKEESASDPVSERKRIKEESDSDSASEESDSDSASEESDSDSVNQPLAHTFSKRERFTGSASQSHRAGLPDSHVELVRKFTNFGINGVITMSQVITLVELFNKWEENAVWISFLLAAKDDEELVKYSRALLDHFS